MKTLGWILGCLLISGPAAAQTLEKSASLSAGAGLESGSTSGTNLLLKLEATPLATGGNPCGFTDSVCQFKTTQMLVLHIDGEAAIDKGAEGWNQVPYLNIRVTPLDIPVAPQRSDEAQEWLGRWGIDRSFHIALAPTQISRDQKFLENASFRVSIVGLDARVQAFPTRYLGVFAQASADLLGYRYFNQELFQFDEGSGRRLLALGDGLAKAGLIFAPSQAFVVRLSGGGSGELDYAVKSGWDKIYRTEVFGELSLSLTRMAEVYGRMSRKARGTEDADSKSYRQIMTGLKLTLDWL